MLTTVSKLIQDRIGEHPQRFDMIPGERFLVCSSYDDISNSGLPAESQEEKMEEGKIRTRRRTCPKKDLLR